MLLIRDNPDYYSRRIIFFFQRDSGGLQDELGRHLGLKPLAQS